MGDYIVSARKYRPSTFGTVVGQRALTTTLKNAIANDKLAHAYLFCGPRGVGKTTCARIFAKTINCLHPTAGGEACNECESCRAFNEQRSYNIHELDAASNNSVEDIRSLIDQVRIPPQIGHYKVYIIDEVHMLSQAAFNAFLKTLEEPPHHAIFILATTEKHKILPTILSRCQIYDFNRISVNDIVEYLAEVAQKEHIHAEPEALNVIAQKADGGMRDALSIFDQVVSFTNGNITYRSVIDNLNVLDYEYYFRLTEAILQNRTLDCMLLLNEILSKGFDGGHFITGLSSHFRDLLVSRDASTLPLLEVGASIRERYQAQAQQCTPRFLYRAMKLSNDCDLNYRASKNKRLLVELTLIQLSQLTADPNDTPGDGRSPRPSISSPFTTPQPTPAPAPTANAGPAATPVPPPAPAPARPVPTGTPAPGSQAAPLPPADQHETGRPKIPVVQAGSLGMSIRRKPPTPAKANTAPMAATGNDATGKGYTDYPFDDKALSFCWREFAAQLPKEEAANAARMMNAAPHLKAEDVFEVTVDNDMVRQYMERLSPQIVAYLQQQLHNRRIRMEVRVSEENETVRAYSPVERFQLMSQKNPSLMKLKETFGLELA